jgi:hypothetical protein
LKRQILFPLSSGLQFISHVFISAFLFFILSSPALTQQVIAAKAGMINYIEGKVFRDNEAVLRIKNRFIALNDGQVLRTDKGLVELLLSPNAYLRVGEGSSLRLEQNVLHDTRVSVERGSALIEVVLGTKGNVMHVRCGTSSVEISRTGLYRIDAGPGELRVYGGTAIVTNGHMKVSVAHGRMVRFGEMLIPSKFDQGFVDSLHEWSARRSFYLFTANSECGKEMKNWVRGTGGGMYNSNFRMRFYWKFFTDEYSARQKALDEAFQ